MINYKLKFTQSEESKHHFISDLHYNHDRDFIWGAPGRQYNSVTEMNIDIIHQWNAYVAPTDTVWHLGDTIFNDWTGADCLKLYEQLNFKVLYEIWGNHRSGTKAIYRELCNDMGLVDQELYPMPLEISPGKTVIFLGHYTEITIDKQRMVLGHYPIESWDGIRKGMIHAHGHCHCTLASTKDTKRIDVGWDNRKRPISFDEIKREMASKKGLSGDHHK